MSNELLAKKLVKLHPEVTKQRLMSDGKCLKKPASEHICLKLPRIFAAHVAESEIASAAVDQLPDFVDPLGKLLGSLLLLAAAVGLLLVGGVVLGGGVPGQTVGIVATAAAAALGLDKIV